MFVELLQRVDFSLSTILSTGLVAYSGYIVALIAYRLFFSPLAGFPGSKLAAATGWYETYYQLLKRGGGQFTFKIAEWHKKYGPIVRINPHEIHIHDPEYYETVYANGQGIDKPNYVEWQFGTPGTVFGTVQHELHRQRKNALLPFFSKRKVTEQIPQIQKHVEKICERLHNEYIDTDNVLNLCNLFSCFAADVITAYSFDRTFNYLETQDFLNPFTASFEGFKGFVHYSIQFPWLPKLLAKIPESIIRYLQPGMVPVLNYQREIRTQVVDIKHRRDKSVNDDREKGTIFIDILDSSLPESEKTTTRLSDEAAGVVGAGIETTKWALVVTFFHIIDNPRILRGLRQELKTAFPDSRSIPSLSELESLPYLMACIEEGLRLSYGSVARSPRIHRTKTLQYRNYTIPPGTPVSCDAWHAHHDESIFPSSFAFIPERWLVGKMNLSRYTMFFGKGSRMCLGLQLGYAEIEMVIAILFRQFDFELFETGREDVDCYHDQISPGVMPGSRGVRVKVKAPMD